LLSGKDHIGDGVMLRAVDHHHMLDVVHTIGMHDFPFWRWVIPSIEMD
jgi:hypothetical protein